MARRLLLFLLPALLLCGCAGYRLGTGSALPFHTLYIEPLSSESGLPQARAVLTARIREDFLRDGRVTLVNSPSQAEAILAITLKSYTREATVSREEDTGLARKFSLRLGAECTLSLGDGKVLFSRRPLEAHRENYVDSGQLQSEYEMVPLLAEKLSALITHAVLDTW